LNISDTPMMAFGAMPVAGRQTAQEVIYIRVSQSQPLFN